MRLPGYKIFFSALIITRLASCTKAGTSEAGAGGRDSVSAPAPDSVLDPAVPASFTDLAYGQEEKQKMDLRLVGGRDMKTPVIMLLHGGAWSAGDKVELAALDSFFIKQGISVANLNYRLTDKSAGSVRWNDILADVSAAVRYLHNRSAQLVSRPDHFVLFGLSAGGHLSLLHAYSYDSAKLVSAVIGFGAPTKFNDIAWKASPFLNVAKTALPPLTGQSFSTDSSNATLKELSPWYATNLKPTLLIHGDQDQEVPYSQSLLMLARLRAAAVAGSLITLSHAGHSGEGVSAAEYDKALAACAAWVKKYSH